MINKETIEKHGFIKTEKNKWMGWKDYVYNNLRNDYGYFLRATIHEPTSYSGNDIYYKMFKIIIHRYAYDVKTVDEWLEQGESNVVYLGLIPTEEYFETLLGNLGIK